MFYSKSAGGFYSPHIHGEAIPPDAQEIPDELYATLIDGQSAGLRIVGSSEGLPTLVAPEEPTAEQVWEAIKAERDRRTQQGGYKVGTHWFHSDTFSRTQQMGLVMLGASLPPGIEWKTMGGAKVQMTQALAQQIFAAAAASDIAIFAAAESHMAAMLASAEPASYDFDGGWPLAFGE